MAYDDRFALLIALIGLTAALIPGVSWWFQRWSKRQDSAIARVEQRVELAVDRINALVRSNGIIKGYTRRLIDILRTNNIEHPNPPDEFYRDDTFIPERDDK